MLRDECAFSRWTWALQFHHGLRKATQWDCPHSCNRRSPRGMRETDTRSAWECSDAQAGGPAFRVLCGDSLFLVKQFFLSGEVQENLSLLGCRSELKRREQAGAVILALAAEHAEDGVQHLAGDRHQSLQFGFVAGQQILVKGTQVGIVAHRD